VRMAAIIFSGAPHDRCASHSPAPTRAVGCGRR